VVDAALSLPHRVQKIESTIHALDARADMQSALLHNAREDLSEIRALCIATSGELAYQRNVLESIAGKLGVEVAGFRPPSDDSLIRRLDQLQRVVKRRAAPKRTWKDWAKLAGGGVAAIAALAAAIQQLAAALGGG